MANRSDVNNMNLNLQELKNITNAMDKIISDMKEKNKIIYDFNRHNAIAKINNILCMKKDAVFHTPYRDVSQWEAIPKCHCHSLINYKRNSNEMESTIVSHAVPSLKRISSEKVQCLINNSDKNKKKNRVSYHSENTNTFNDFSGDKLCIPSPSEMPAEISKPLSTGMQYGNIIKFTNTVQISHTEKTNDECNDDNGILSLDTNRPVSGDFPPYINRQLKTTTQSENASKNSSLSTRYVKWQPVNDKNNITNKSENAVHDAYSGRSICHQNNVTPLEEKLGYIVFPHDSTKSQMNIKKILTIQKPEKLKNLNNNAANPLDQRKKILEQDNRTSVVNSSARRKLHLYHPNQMKLENSLGILSDSKALTDNQNICSQSKIKLEESRTQITDNVQCVDILYLEDVTENKSIEKIKGVIKSFETLSNNLTARVEPSSDLHRAKHITPKFSVVNSWRKQKSQMQQKKQVEAEAPIDNSVLKELPEIKKSETDNISIKEVTGADENKLKKIEITSKNLNVTKLPKDISDDNNSEKIISNTLDKSKVIPKIYINRYTKPQTTCAVLQVKSRASKISLQPNLSKIISPIKSSVKYVLSQTNQQYQEIVNVVNRAIIENKTFTIVGGYNPLRRALIQRGWVEKIWFPENRRSIQISDDLPIVELIRRIKHPEYGDRYQKALISKLLANNQVDFCWDLFLDSNPFKIYSDKIKQTIINRYPAHSIDLFTTKVGLSDTLKNHSHWFLIKGKSGILFPRSYNLGCEHEKKQFIEDFRLTAATSLLNWVIKTNETNKQLVSNYGKIHMSIFHFAMTQCHNYLKTRQHKDIDEDIHEAREVDWNVFLENFYRITYYSNHFRGINENTKDMMIQQAKEMIKWLEPYWPYMDMDGYMNLWLVKPNNDCKGNGIIICRTLRNILDFIGNNRDKNFIVQKYIERPLLIHSTKFDIRQWFLICHQPNLHVWMYRDYYLRFSSQIYDLHKLDESVHLTNYAIQRKYRNCKRYTSLPPDNMWHSDTFKRYLKDIGFPMAWKGVYKGMKESMIGVIMCSRDEMESRINSYEVLGADFMLNERFEPFLIEINSAPGIQNSSEVTTKMCPLMLNDVVKVTVDYAQNPNSSTGKFELIYTEKDIFSEKKVNLSVSGINYFQKYKLQNIKKSIKQKDECKDIDTNFATDLIDNIFREYTEEVQTVLNPINVISTKSEQEYT